MLHGFKVMLFVLQTIREGVRLFENLFVEPQNDHWRNDRKMEVRGIWFYNL